jgi:glycosyltransferase involved in cell wall biosynthesis
MKIALIAPPFICVPPKLYGGTELFVAELAEGLKCRKIEVVVYTNGESEIEVEKRWLYEKAQWPITGEIYDNLKDINHTSWSIADATRDCDIIHLNNLPGLAQSRLTPPHIGFVYTIHHPYEQKLSEFYSHFPDVEYVTISEFQARHETMPNIRAIHHGLDVNLYRLNTNKQHYLSFLGRIAPIKGTHLAIQVAKRSGIPLKIAGEIQPLFRDYFESEIKPHLDGHNIEYIGEADLAAKNELLGNSMALLFPIQWDEPFGLVMIEAMACGTPVLALPGGSVPEVVKDGVSGYVCKSADEMAERAKNLDIAPERTRRYVEENFSLDNMVDRYLNLYRELYAARHGLRQGAKAEKHRAIA